MSDKWQRFIDGQESSHNVAPVIYRSWLRSKSLNVDHARVAKNDLLPAPRLRERCQAQEDFIEAAKPVLPYIFNLLQGLNYVVLLCDKEGYVLDSLGDPPFLSKAQLVHLSPGASWREEVKGTNAIGTALTENNPTAVLGWEHFVKENHFLACWAAPIRNSCGETVGVLDISGEAAGKNRRLLETVIMGAKMIEQNMQLLELKRSTSITRQGIELAGEMLQEGFIAIDKLGIITEINSRGAHLLGRRREEVIGKPASDVFLMTKGWTFSHDSLYLQLKEHSGNEVFSRLRQINDSDGNPMGVVGVIQPSAAKAEPKRLWVGRSELTHQVFERAEKAASSGCSVLITGESGTGKEVVARYIHQTSPRHAGPFIALNCAALPHTLVESELFGYADGAFTGARRGGQAGKFELANGGTIFLDEIGDMPLDVQVNLLRVLQEKEVIRIGDSKARKVDVRIIAATHKNLPALVSGGLFRLDLYYRLKVVTIDLPPLRNRLDDLWDLVPRFIEKACSDLSKPLMEISEQVYECLFAHSWPGNIRELENCIESMVAMADGPALTVDDLPVELKVRSGLPEVKSKQTLLDQQTRQAIIQALNQTKGKIAPAAKLLGIGRNTLYRKMKELGVRP